MPPDLLRRIAEGAGPDHPEVPDDAAAAAQRTLDADAQLRQLREVVAERGRGDLRGPDPGLPNLREQRSPEIRSPGPGRAGRPAGRLRRPARRPSCRARWSAARDKPATSDDSVNRAYDGLGATWQLYWSAFQRDSLDAKGLEADRVRPLRGAVRQRVLGRPADGLRGRRRHLLQRLHVERRRHRARADPRRDPVHRGPHLRHPVRRPQRVAVRLLRVHGQAAGARAGRRRRRLAHRRGAVHREGQRRGAAVDEGAGHGLRRPGAGQGPAAGRHGRLRQAPRRRAARQRRGPHQLRHPQPRVLPRGDRHRRSQLGGCRAGLVRRR